MRRFWVALAIFAAVAAAAWLGICRPYTLPMGGMEPTLYRGDKVLVVKRWCDRRLRRGDVVVYDAPIGGDGTGRAAATEQCVARVAAMPGDTIHLDSAMCLTDGDGRLDAEISAWRVNPYIGIGIGHAIPERRFGCQFDVGVMFHGKPAITSANASVMPVHGDGLESNGLVEALGNMTVYPVVSLKLIGRIF